MKQIHILEHTTEAQINVSDERILFNRRKIRPFFVIVRKEITDHLRSWRFIVLAILTILTCFASLYTGLKGMAQPVRETAIEDDFFFLRIFTATDGTLPPFTVFISFLGPLLGLGLGFDAINSEQNRGTLTRLLAQPIPRDYVLTAKFTAALIVITAMFTSLCLLIMGFGLFRVGIPPTPEEFCRVLCFVLLSSCYVAFWLNLAILFSIKFRQPATAALCGIAVWLFFTIFYQIIVNIVAKASEPGRMASQQQIIHYQEFIANLLRIVPSQLYSEATTTLLVPAVRSIGPLAMEQVHGAIPSALPLGQSLLVVWPQITGMVAATAICFAIAYNAFMRKEIRSR
ncbi:MAG TPA: ABC transporter permease [Chryseolinea sp.]